MHVNILYKKFPSVILFYNNLGLSLPRYLQAGGAPSTVVELLSENFTAIAGMVNVTANWLIQTGDVCKA